MTRTANHKSKTLRVSIIPKPEWETNLRAFKELCARDGLSMSEELYTLIVEVFFKKHNWPLGNPQNLILQFVEGYEQKEKPKYRIKNGKIYCEERDLWVWRAVCVQQQCCGLAEVIIKDLEEQNRKNML